MFKVDVVIVGLNHKVLEVLPRYQGKQILVIDDKTFRSYSAVQSFDDEFLFGIYQSSLEAAQFEIKEFDDTKEFYQMIIGMHQTAKHDRQKQLINQLKAKAVMVEKGRTVIKDNHHLSISYLENTTDYQFDTLILNTGQSEKKDDPNPFIFTLEELLETQLLPKEMIVEVRTLKDLEIAKLFSHFGTTVKALMIDNAFLKIDHLMFRDAIKHSLNQDNIEVVDKVEIKSVEQQASFGIVNYQTKTETKQDTFTVLLRSESPTPNTSGLGLENIDNYLKIDDLISKPSLVSKEVMHVSPAYVKVEHTQASGQQLVVRLNGDELRYLHLLNDEVGGIEVHVNQEAHVISSALFYCQHSLILADIVTMMMENNISLDYFKDHPFPATSIMSIFNDIEHQLVKES